MTRIRRFAAAALALAFAGAGLGGCQKEEGPAERAGKQLDKAVDSAGKQVDKAVDSAGKQVEKAGEKIQDAARDARK